MINKLLGASAVGAAALLFPIIAGAMGRGSAQPRGSANTEGHRERLVNQVLGLLNESGISAQRATDGGPQIELGTDDERAADGAHAVAERVLLSTGYRPKTVKVGRGYRISVDKGPAAPASADPALRL